MALPRPTKFPEWARVPYVDPVTGGNNIVEPTEQKKDDGWLRNEKPPANIQNWLHNLADEWLKYLDSLSTGGTFTTGDWKFSDKLTEDPLIWLLADDGTIGNDSSVADHKGDEFKDLFIFYYDNYSDTKCPVLPGGRGASAEADWTANKNLKILTKKDRFPVAASSATEYLPGDIGGLNAVGLTATNNGPHTHNFNYTLVVSPGTDIGAGANYEDSATGAGTTASDGAGTPHENRPAYFASNIFIKL